MQNNSIFLMSFMSFNPKLTKVGVREREKEIFSELKEHFPLVRMHLAVISQVTLMLPCNVHIIFKLYH